MYMGGMQVTFFADVAAIANRRAAGHHANVLAVRELLQGIGVLVAELVCIASLAVVP